MRYILWIRLAFLSALLFVSGVQAASYEINPGDVISVDVWGEEDVSREVLVRPDGYFSLPIAGDIQAEGHSPSQVADYVATALAQFMKDKPRVVVSVVGVTGNKIYVMGKVVRPGEFVINGQTDVIQALALAGGLNSFAAENDIVVLRRGSDGQQTAIPFRYANVKKGKDLKSNILLQSRDVIVVP